MKKIAVVGTHGAGKSTLCYKLASHYKSLGKNVDIIQERVRFSPFPFNEKMTTQTALWAYHTQIQRELESEAKKFDTVICDRSSVDPFMYAAYWGINEPILAMSEIAAKCWLYSYDKIFLVDPDVPIEDDGVRSTDQDFQDGVHRNFKGLFNSLATFSVARISSSMIFDAEFNIKEIVNG